MVMMLTKLSLFLEVVSSGCLCLSVRFVRKDFYCEGNSVFMQEIIIEKDFYSCKYFGNTFARNLKFILHNLHLCGLFHCDRICSPRAGELINVSSHCPHLYGFLCVTFIFVLVSFPSEANSTN